MTVSLVPAIDYDLEFLKCAGMPAYLCHTYCIIDDVQGGGTGTGTMPFHLWDYQVEMMDLLWPDSENFQRQLILLKARQLGMSWVCCAYALWLCLFNPNKFVLIMSKGSVEAKEMVSRIASLYKRLPQWLKDRCPKLITDNKEDIGWDNSSRVHSQAATKDAGSGFTISLLLLDEFAKMLFAGETYTAVMPTVDAGGQVVIISTAKGVGNPFNTLWDGAESGENGFYPFFLPWHVRPGRDQDWYDRVLARQSDPEKMLQEYPSTAQEAFLASGRARFSYSWIKRHEEANKRAPIWSSKAVPQLMPPASLPDSLRILPDLRIYQFPIPGGKYVVTCDPSMGKSDSDPSPAMVFDAETWEEVAFLYGRYEATLFGIMLSHLGRYYNLARINVPRIMHGGTTLASLVAESYPHIVWGPDKQRGWPESPKWKTQGVDSLAVALRDDDIQIHSAEFYKEAQIYQVNDNGSTSAPPLKHDDLITVAWLFTALMNRPTIKTQAYVPQAYEVQRSTSGTTYVQNGYNGNQARSSAPGVLPALPNGFSILPK